MEVSFSSSLLVLCPCCVICPEAHGKRVVCPMPGRHWSLHSRFAQEIQQFLEISGMCLLPVSVTVVVNKPCGAVPAL